MNKKICTICNLHKPVSEFYNKQSRCKICLRAIVNKNYIPKIRKPKLKGILKTCSYCGLEKDITKFRHNYRKCIECTKLIQEDNMLGGDVWDYFEPNTKEYIENFVRNEIIPALEKEYLRIKGFRRIVS